MIALLDISGTTKSVHLRLHMNACSHLKSPNPALSVTFSRLVIFDLVRVSLAKIHIPEKL